jgi:hypothetical protein
MGEAMTEGQATPEPQARKPRWKRWWAITLYALVALVVGLGILGALVGDNNVPPEVRACDSVMDFSRSYLPGAPVDYSTLQSANDHARRADFLALTAAITRISNSVSTNASFEEVNSQIIEALVLCRDRLDSMARRFQ